MAKNSNKFDLNKTSERKFDLAKGKERKFDLSKEEDSVVVKSVNSGSNELTKSQPKKKWPYVVGLLIIIALLVWCGFKYLGNHQDELADIENPEIVIEDSIAVVDDTLVLDDEEVSDDESNAESEDIVMAEEDVQSTESNDEEVPSVSENNSTFDVSQKETSDNVSASNIEQKALEVIRGNFGNGKERREKLGAEYSIIQSKVNEIYAKKGLVY
jgi:hypothetical protein